MRLPTEAEFWVDTKKVITAISQDAPNYLLVEKKPSWLFISHQNDPWFNLGYAHNMADIEVLSQKLRSESLPGILYGNSDLLQSNNEHSNFLRCSTMQFHRFGVDSDANWNYRRLGIKVEKATDYDQVFVSNKIQSETFGMDEEVIENVVGKKVLADKNVGIYNLVDRGHPVSTVTIFRGELAGSKVIQVWSMATLPEEQGKGYGKHLLGQILSDSLKNGFMGAALMASPEGKYLYDRLGFVSLVETPIFEVGQEG